MPSSFLGKYGIWKNPQYSHKNSLVFPFLLYNVYAYDYWLSWGFFQKVLAVIIRWFIIYCSNGTFLTLEFKKNYINYFHYCSVYKKMHSISFHMFAFHCCNLKSYIFYLRQIVILAVSYTHLTLPTICSV